MMEMEQSRPSGIAVITGAAAGMGEATARLFCEAGWPLLLCDLNRAKLEAMAASLQPKAEVQLLAADIASPTLAEQLKPLLEGRFVGALVHCAGLSPSMADPARILDVNLAGSMRLLQAVRPYLSPGAAAVLLASMSGHMLPLPGADAMLDKITAPEDVASLLSHPDVPKMAYSVSKRGVQRLARREAFSFGRQGARIVSLSPGIIDTPMGRAELAVEPRMQNMISGSPLPRMGTADEIASVALFLCSSAASFITGIDVPVDGGALAVFPPAAR